MLFHTLCVLYLCRIGWLTVERRRVPQQHRPVAAGRDHAMPVRAKADVTRVSSEGDHLMSRFQVPKFDCSIACCGNYTRSVRCEGYSMH